jgi:High potential iron-sulfur protein
MTMRPTRRTFLMVTSVAVGAAPLCSPAFAQAGSHVEETDDQAAALGYKHDTKKVDGKKFPKHDAQQHCANCSFWQGKPTDAWAGCAMFGRKHIASGGWCTAWAKAPG